MKNKKYWRKRFEQLQEKLLKPSDAYVEDLDVIYSKALNNIHNDLNKWYLRFMDNNGIVDYHQAKQTLNKKELKELRWTLDDYIKYGQENAVNEKWIHELENASARVHITRLEALELQVNNYVEKLYSNYFNTTNSLVRNTIENSYYGTVYEISKGLNVKFDSFFIDKRKINKLIAKPWSYSGENFSSNIWKNKDLLINNLHKNLVSGLISNKTPDKIITDFSKSMKSSRNNAARVIMTENAYFSILGQEECYSDLGIKKFEIVGTLDKTTCKHCGSFDGKVVNIKEFEAGVTVPPFHPYCRCTTVPYFNDEFTQDSKRIARDKDGSIIYVDYDMNYEEWKKDYLKNDNIKNDNINNPNFIKIKNQENVNENDLQRVEKELNLIPDKHKALLKDYIKEIHFHDNRYSCYDRENRIVHLLKDLEEGEVIHEIAHALETKLDLYHNNKFLNVLSNGLENISVFDIMFDEETFARPVVTLSNSKFISKYQGYLYKNDEIGNFYIDYNKGCLNFKCLGEYFSEGYREYIFNPENLKLKDIKLFNFIERL